MILFPISTGIYQRFRQGGDVDGLIQSSAKLPIFSPNQVLASQLNKNIESNICQKGSKSHIFNLVLMFLMIVSRISLFNFNAVIIDRSFSRDILNDTGF